MLMQTLCPGFRQVVLDVGEGRRSVEDRNFVGVNCIETLMIIVNLTLSMVIFSVNNY